MTGPTRRGFGIVSQSQAFASHMPHHFRLQTTRAMSSTSANDLIKSSIAENKVMVFSKSYCPYCTSKFVRYVQLRVAWRLDI
jgi:hypothetical protein